MRWNFKIKHLMYLTLWTALILASRDFLIQAVPEFVRLTIWLSGAGAVALFVGLYGIALMMPDCSHRDRLVNKLCYFLIGDGILFFLFAVTNVHLIKQ
jgi:hypothetical protein